MTHKALPHTPGPWTWTTDRSGPLDEWDCATRGPVDVREFVSTGYGNNPELYAANGECVVSAGGGEYTPYNGATPAEAVANAMIIAAAPTMYRALLRITRKVPKYSDDYGLEWAQNQARRALAGLLR